MKNKYQPIQTTIFDELTMQGYSIWDVQPERNIKQATAWDGKITAFKNEHS